MRPTSALRTDWSAARRRVGGDYGTHKSWWAARGCESFCFERSERFELDLGNAAVQDSEARLVAVGDGDRNLFAGFEAEVRDFVASDNDATDLSDFDGDVIYVGILPNGYPVPIGPRGLHADRRSVLRVSAAARSNAVMVAAETLSVVVTLAWPSVLSAVLLEDAGVETTRLLTGEAPEGLIQKVSALIESEGFTVSFGDCGRANGLTNWTKRTVTIRADLEPAAQFKTVCNEATHVLAHSLQIDTESTCRGTKKSKQSRSHLV